MQTILDSFLLNWTLYPVSDVNEIFSHGLLCQKYLHPALAVYFQTATLKYLMRELSVHTQAHSATLHYNAGNIFQPTNDRK